MYKTGFNQVVMDNKYKWMDYNTYFSNIIDKIRKNNEILSIIIEINNLNSITKVINKSINSNSNKLIYRTSLIQFIPIKLYNIIKF